MRSRILKWIGDPPKCKTCNKPIKEWDFFADKHEHISCLTDRISDSMLRAFVKNSEVVE